MQAEDRTIVEDQVMLARPRFPLRRLLLLPAALLVLVAAPALGQEAGPVDGPATTTDLAITAPGETVATGWTSEPTAVDANLVGVTWEGEPSTAFTVEVRRTDETEWSKPTEIEGGFEADDGTQDATAAAAIPDHATEPVWVGDDVAEVRVQVADGEATNVTIAAVGDGSTEVPADAAAALDVIPRGDQVDRIIFGAVLLVIALGLGALALGWSPWRARRRVRTLLGLAALAALTLTACVPVVPPSPGIPNGSVMPPIHSRGEWGARAFGTGPAPCPGGPEYASALKFAVVHHTVNSNNYTAAQVPQMLRSIQAYHMDANGYCDTAYNFIIDRFGQIWEARAGGVDRPVIGGHAGGFNTGSVGIALLGDHSVAPIAGPELDSLIHLLRWRLSIARLTPSQGFVHTVGSSPCNCMHWPPGTPVWFPNLIVGHRDVDQTACPGNAVANRLGEIRQSVESGLAFPAAPTT